MKLKYVFAALLTLIISPAHAELEIDVRGATRNPMPIAIPEMIGNNGNFFTKIIGNDYGDKVREVLAADLDRSGLFKVLPTNSYIETLTSIDQQPKFVNWQAIKSQALVQSQIVELPGEKIRVDFRLWDVASEQQLIGKSFTTTKSNWRRIAHVVADAIYERLTGDKGYFNTRVVYVSETGRATRRIKRLAMMDQDGENHKFLTDGRNLVLTPRFSPNMQKITYLEFVGNSPRVYMLDLDTNRRQVLGNFPGMTFAPVFSPDSSKVLLSYANHGSTNIYEMDIKTRKTRQITYGSAISTSPSYSPDGSKIVFNSDRGGNQQLYVMNADGSDVERISFGKGRYATPVWSPRGDYIAFTKMVNGAFYIGVMYPDGTGERILADGYLVEGPTWSPNGRVLMYFRQDRGSPVRLYSIDLTGYNERRIVTPAEASDPAWSPLLPL
ncbi:MAG: Tol-Pal system beta propeller repeat protein TolB [Alphaproteobacteria bacterium]|nr:Tol-Pal system beta propeller repeat protein TolB [Alphaproteobacteria bacterium]MDY4690152.1 Tol-Pal system beta propeller repeat protein TolB [Alphaproteobacteria bacterium]